jgi:uncharacterized protein (DUF305 family)
MKRLFILACLSSAILAACNGNNSNSTTSTDSSATANQSTTAENTAAPTSPTNNASATFKEAMDKMMSDMHSMQMSGDPDHDFATMMKQHHQGAIDMANIEVAKGSNAELKQVAQKIIDDSQKDNSDLTAFLGSHQPSKKTDFGKNQMDKMMKSMNMDMKESGDVDKDFAMMMSMHHQDGIQMAKDYLKVATAEETKKVANNTIKSNGEDLKVLKAHNGMDMSGHHDMKGMEMKDSAKK